MKSALKTEKLRKFAFFAGNSRAEISEKLKKAHLNRRTASNKAVD